MKYAKEKLEDDLIHLESIEDVAGWGVKAIIEQEEWKIGKAGFVREEDAEQFAEQAAERLAGEGKTVVFVQKAGKLVALFGLMDRVRKETTLAIDRLKAQGIYTIMLTGDSTKTAKVISDESHVDEYIAECLPENKVEHLKQLKGKAMGMLLWLATGSTMLLHLQPLMWELLWVAELTWHLRQQILS